MFNYYSINGKLLFSRNKYQDLINISEDDAFKLKGIVYYLHNLPPIHSRRSFCISDPSLFYLEKEGLDLLQKKATPTRTSIPEWLIHKIKCREIMAVNTAYPFWLDVLDINLPPKWRIHLVGTGDVGGILAAGLRLLGGGHISMIGLYGKDDKSTKRWEYEINQILPAFSEATLPNVTIIQEEELFNCDLFIFCASVGVPPVGEESKDVRAAQLEGNSKIISSYAVMARKSKFKGIFAVVSDPVDLLCKAAFLASNKDQYGAYDFLGLAPEQIRGYGLGVMHARAVYYSQQSEDTKHYIREGRAYGPHGEGLIIADSINNYNDCLSEYLTDAARRANLDVRATGYKPYIAPALSSGTLSILATIKGDWHYSATFIGGVFMGAKNRLTETGTEIEQLDLSDRLMERLNKTYSELGNY